MGSEFSHQASMLPSREQPSAVLSSVVRRKACLLTHPSMPTAGDARYMFGYGSYHSFKSLQKQVPAVLTFQPVPPGKPPDL